MSAGRQGSVLVVMVYPMEKDGHICVAQNCRRLIEHGENVVESPSCSGFYYHWDCFIRMVLEEGKVLSVVDTQVVD